MKTVYEVMNTDGNTFYFFLENRAQIANEIIAVCEELELTAEQVKIDELKVSLKRNAEICLTDDDQIEYRKDYEPDAYLNTSKVLDMYEKGIAYELYKGCGTGVVLNPTTTKEDFKTLYKYFTN